MMLRTTTLIAVTMLSAGLAACAGVEVNPPIAGTEFGAQGGPAVRVAENGIPQAARGPGLVNGVAAFAGTAGEGGGSQSGGRPSFTYSGGVQGDVAGVPAEFRPLPHPRGA